MFPNEMARWRGEEMIKGYSCSEKFEAAGAFRIFISRRLIQSGSPRYKAELLRLRPMKPTWFGIHDLLAVTSLPKGDESLWELRHHCKHQHSPPAIPHCTHAVSCQNLATPRPPTALRNLTCAGGQLKTNNADSPKKIVQTYRKVDHWGTREPAG